MAGWSGKVALIAGVTGQDGAHLAAFLLSKGYLVHGVKRRSSSFNTERIDHLIYDPHEQGVSFHLHYGDVTDATKIIRIIQETRPDEIYNLAAQSMCRSRSRRRSTPPTPTHSGPSACSRPSVSWAWSARPASIRPRPPSCSARCRRSRNGRPRRSTRALLTLLPSFTRIGSRSTTARPTAFTPPTEFFSTTRAPSGAKPSSPARSHERSRRSSAGCNRSCSSAISMLRATGDTPATLSRGCG